MILPDKIVRSNRKTLAITIDSCGRLIVRAPRTCAQSRIDAFLQSKASWIEKHQRKAEKNAVSLPTDTLAGYRFPWLGGWLLVETGNGSRVRWDRDISTIYLPNESYEKQCERLKNLLKKDFSRVIAPRVAYYEAQMGVAVQSVTVTQTKSRWGSCTAKNAVRFTFRAGYFPIEVVDYLIVHELAHVKEKNHGKRFWEIVERHCPNCRALRGCLKEYRGYLGLF